jgi:hypothetical protein
MGASVSCGHPTMCTLASDRCCSIRWFHLKTIYPNNSATRVIRFTLVNRPSSYSSSEELFHTLHAAEQAGLSPGITSAFRDDYRQSIASGLKAAADRSFHGGSFRGAYGHGLAADAVSVKGATRAQRWISTESFWKWIDAHGKEFGIGRRISIGIHRMWHRSTAKNMPLTTAGRKRNRRDRI